MKRVHICLLSEQPTPNIGPLMDRRYRPDNAVFVVTPQQKERLDFLLPILQKYGVTAESLPIEDAFDSDTILKTLENKIDQLKKEDKDIWVNVTGGTKPMAIAAHLAAFNKDVPAFYVDGNKLIWLLLNGESPDGETTQVMKEKLKINDFLQAHGVKELSRRTQQPKQELMEIAKHLISTPSAYLKGMRTWNYVASKAEKSLTYTLSDQDKKNEGLQAVIDIFKSSTDLLATQEKITFPDETFRFFCAGGWLEDYITKTINSIAEETGIQDHATSLKVEYLSERKINRNYMNDSDNDNEIDVAILHKNVLHIIECKAKRLDGNSGDIQDDLYKLATLRKYLGGIRTKAMLISYQPLPEADKTRAMIKRRADILDIEFVAGDDLRGIEKKIKKWLG